MAELFGIAVAAGLVVAGVMSLLTWAQFAPDDDE